MLKFFVSLIRCAALKKILMQYLSQIFEILNFYGPRVSNLQNEAVIHVLGRWFVLMKFIKYILYIFSKKQRLVSLDSSSSNYF